MTVKSRPDWKFGLGMGCDPDVIDHLATKYPDVTREATEAAEAKAKAAAAAAAASRPAAAKNRLPEPGAASVRLMAHEAGAREEAVDEVLDPEAQGLWEADVDSSALGGAASTKGARASMEGRAFGVRELSTLEQKYMASAAARQRENQVVKQVVGGKEWTGAPFLCKPAELVFADFDVGETYELQFTLTNVSYTFNGPRAAATAPLSPPFPFLRRPGLVLLQAIKI